METNEIAYMTVDQQIENLAAHGGRIYNYKCNSQLRFMNLSQDDVHGFSQLLFLLHIFDYQMPYDHLSQALTHQLNRHCGPYPEDVTYLGQILNIDISLRETVWVTQKSNKYHKDEHCSGIKNPSEIDIAEAKSHGLSPCKKCCD